MSKGGGLPNLFRPSETRTGWWMVAVNRDETPFRQCNRQGPSQQTFKLILPSHKDFKEMVAVLWRTALVPEDWHGKIACRPRAGEGSITKGQQGDWRFEPNTQLEILIARHKWVLLPIVFDYSFFWSVVYPLDRLFSIYNELKIRTGVPTDLRPRAFRPRYYRLYPTKPGVAKIRLVGGPTTAPAPCIEADLSEFLASVDSYTYKSNGADRGLYCWYRIEGTGVKRLEDLKLMVSQDGDEWHQVPLSTSDTSRLM